MHTSHFQSRPLAALALVVASGLAGPWAHAEGLYVGGGVFHRHYDLSQPGAVDDRSPKGFVLSGKLMAGYEFSPTWGVEGGFADFGRPLRYTLGGSSGRVRTSGSAWYGAVKANLLNVSDSVSFFGKVGVDRHRFSVSGQGAGAGLARSGNTTALYVGLGSEIKIAKGLATTVELEHFGTEKRPGSSLTGLSVNIKYAF